MTENNAPQEPVFVRGNEHLDRLLSDPQIAADVAQARAGAEEMDRVQRNEPGDDPQGSADDPGRGGPETRSGQRGGTPDTPKEAPQTQRRPSGSGSGTGLTAT